MPCDVDSKVKIAQGGQRSLGLRRIVNGPTDEPSLLCDGEGGGALDIFYLSFETVRPGDLTPTGMLATESRQVNIVCPSDLRPTGRRRQGNVNQKC